MCIYFSFDLSRCCYFNYFFVSLLFVIWWIILLLSSARRRIVSIVGIFFLFFCIVWRIGVYGVTNRTSWANMEELIELEHTDDERDKNTLTQSNDHNHNDDDDDDEEENIHKKNLRCSSINTPNISRWYTRNWRKINEIYIFSIQIYMCDRTLYSLSWPFIRSFTYKYKKWWRHGSMGSRTQCSIDNGYDSQALTEI